ncbi:hypothetical protein VU12_11880, partial [Desulfobulbus sp. US4]|nr:hypothetical protein [Desulfobulbus sp. US4]
MKSTDFFHLKTVRFFLLIAALAGVFLLGRCSQPEPVKEPIPMEQPVPSEQPAEEKELIRVEPRAPSEQPAEEQPRGEKEPAVEEKTEPVQPEPGSTLDEAESSLVSTTETAEQEEVQFDEQCRDIRLDAQSCVFPFLHPGGSGPAICVAPEQKESLPPPVVLLKPAGKKRRIAPPGRSVQEYFADIVGEDDTSACEGGLIPALRATVAFLESRSILYGIGPLSDCSGIFHRVLLGMKRRCPDHAYPLPKQYRDSRNIARWYHEQGELILIRNALERPDLIRPGMVFFFGRAGVVYKKFTVKSLLTRRNGIRHVGVVTRVHKDKSGKVISYELFHGHGRRGKTAASITRWHRRTPTKAGYPPFGNGCEQLVAAARLV